MSIVHVISVQPYGYIDGAEDCGSGALGSRARLDKGLEIARELSRTDEVLFLFPQGYGKEDPTKPEGRAVSLGESMARYVERMLPKEHPRIRVYSRPLSWGTAKDLLAVRIMTSERGFGFPPHMHFVTDPVHLKRVRLIWKHVNLFDWPATFHPSVQHRMTWKERWIREPLARLQYRYRCFAGDLKYMLSGR